MSSMPLNTVESRKIRYAAELAAYSFLQFQSACLEAEAHERERELAQQGSSASAPSLNSTTRIRSLRDPGAGTNGDARARGEGEYILRGSGRGRGRVVEASRSAPPDDPATPRAREPVAGTIQADYGASVDGVRGGRREEKP
ncbi:hypothetical protein BS47DRAFT_1336660 [Hydnum rufescens UP504]|uniref:Uncharacterized protein n=1 Tax=Hydnum rufescens UP504 TaxID=1448309 RepID=A0A9P6BAI2_9AGAM|nr:hypothetical protein BS47DRAFT_1336660 [Hydnum rufescens UP504]